eukprot:TRINITY_DN30287_c0_g1_i1.p1 TRINITY_DN30287_c0_g1~~TRINITY_DN30287_c0_g1_i1.p1  ORF type:complete len:1178 (-),score=201.03 TRINITY_DN30287_c0_g1_i1:512-4045(-)
MAFWSSTDLGDDERGFGKLLQLRQTAVQAERRDVEALGALQAGIRRAAGRPSWMEKRAVPTLGTAAASTNTAWSMAASPSPTPIQRQTAGSELAKATNPPASTAAFAMMASSRCIAADTASARSGWGACVPASVPTSTSTTVEDDAVPSCRNGATSRGGTRSGWGNLWSDTATGNRAVASAAEVAPTPPAAKQTDLAMVAADTHKYKSWYEPVNHGATDVADVAAAGVDWRGDQISSGWTSARSAQCAVASSVAAMRGDGSGARPFIERQESSSTRSGDTVANTFATRSGFGSGGCSGGAVGPEDSSGVGTPWWRDRGLGGSSRVDNVGDDAIAHKVENNVRASAVPAPSRTTRVVNSARFATPSAENATSRPQFGDSSGSSALMISPPSAPPPLRLRQHRGGGSIGAASTIDDAPLLELSRSQDSTLLATRPIGNSRSHRKVRRKDPSVANHAKRAELEALRQVSLAEDEAIMQQLEQGGRGGGDGHRVATGEDSRRNVSTRPPPSVPRPSQVPPSLRAWRRNRGMEEVIPGSSREDQKREAARMKNSLVELQDEMKKLQDLMIEDAEELADNVKQIQDEMRLARRRRLEGSSGTPSTTAGPSTSTSAYSSAAPSCPGTPQGGGPRALGPVEIRHAMLRAAAASVEDRRQAASGQSCSTSACSTPRGGTLMGRGSLLDDVSKPPPLLSVRPLPVGTMHSLRLAELGREDKSQRGLDIILARSPQLAILLAELLVGASGLVLGSVCRSAALALHTNAGQRIWPNVEVEVRQCRADEVVRALSSAVAWESVRCLSFYGAADSAVGELLQLLGCNANGGKTPVMGAWGPPVHCSESRVDQRVFPPTELPLRATPTRVIAIRFSCTSSGSAGAVNTRNRYGDGMGIGEVGFRALMARLDPGNSSSSSRIKHLDVSWNHLGDGAMKLLRCGWPEGLESLSLKWNDIGTDGATQLAVALASSASASLHTLELRSNPLGDRGVVTICEAAAERVGLRWLGMGETSLTDEGAKEAMPQLRWHPTLTGVDIGENLLTDASCKHIAEVIEGAPCLQNLVLRGFLFEPTRIGDAGGKILAAALGRRGNDSSFALDLDYQQVGCGTAAELARCCGAWSRLSLFNTDVSTMGAMSLASAFRNRRDVASTLRLNVAQCRLNSGAVEMLRGVGFARLDSHGQRARLIEAAC